jgi:UDP-GlcNAc:undecaprenyl-phosphate GlcNAc-1-phosphate transferase
VFIYDMVYITVDRVLSGKIRSVRDWIEHVGRDHLHHRLEAVLGNRTHTVLFIYALSSALGIGATVLLMASPLSAWLLICQTVSILVTVTILERRGRWQGSRVGSLAPGEGEGQGEGSAGRGRHVRDDAH